MREIEIGSPILFGGEKFAVVRDIDLEGNYVVEYLGKRMTVDRRYARPAPERLPGFFAAWRDSLPKTR